jgi:Plasmid pRiA4b ORF-3-like protein
MTAPDTSPPVVYQLRVVLRGISPLIWRRLLVAGDTSIAGLHDVLQVAFGWSGDHLHCFKVHGREYGLCYDGGPAFRDDARRVRLDDLGLRVGERFVYDYDLGALWRHDLRVEQKLAPVPGRSYPRCTGGRRAGPPEGCGGPEAFIKASQPYRLVEVVTRVAEIIEQALADASVLDGRYEELICLRPWLMTGHFDRRALNKALARPSEPEVTAA